MTAPKAVEAEKASPTQEIEAALGAISEGAMGAPQFPPSTLVGMTQILREASDSYWHAARGPYEPTDLDEAVLALARIVNRDVAAVAATL